MTPAKISVIIATRNRAGLLPRAVDSARTAGADVEIVVVDDASTDSTPEVCAGFSGVEVIRLGKNRGLAAARNAGLDKCRGDLLAFLDDDDVRMPGSLDRQREFLQAHPEAVAAYGRVFLFDDSPGSQQREVWPSEVKSGDLFWDLVRSNFIPVCGILVRKECVSAVGGFDPRLATAEDWDLWLRISESSHFAAQEDIVAGYRRPALGSDQLSSRPVLMKTTSARVQARALALPRARRASAPLRQALRRWHLRVLWSELLIEVLGADAAGAIVRWLTAACIFPTATFGSPLAWRVAWRAARKNILGWPANSRTLEELKDEISRCLGNEVARIPTPCAAE